MNTRRETLQRLVALIGAGSVPVLPLLSACGGGGGEPVAAEPSALDAEFVTAAPLPAAAAGAAHVLVVGGGMGGATLAKYLRLWSNGAVAVTLVDRDAAYSTCILSSLVLTGQRSLAAGTVSRAALASRYGVKLVTGEVAGIDAANRSVTLADGTRLRGDRLVLAPGLAFDRLPGLESDAAFEAHPHAWKAGAQTTTLAAQLKAMRAGGSFVLTIPPAPYRCPPGPYERASLVADWLKLNKPGSKVIVLDANPAITAERGTFTRAFGTTHAGVVEYVPNAVVQSIDVASATVTTTLGSFRADVLNPIPPQRAPALLADAGLVNVAGRWAGVDVLSYESSVAPGVHVIGDACGTTQPKSGHIANQEAKVCADAIIRALRGSGADDQFGLLLDGDDAHRLVAERELRLRPGHAHHGARGRCARRGRERRWRQLRGHAEVVRRDHEGLVRLRGREAGPAEHPDRGVLLRDLVDVADRLVMWLWRPA